MISFHHLQKPQTFITWFTAVMIGMVVPGCERSKTVVGNERPVSDPAATSANSEKETKSPDWLSEIALLAENTVQWKGHENFDKLRQSLDQDVFSNLLQEIQTALKTGDHVKAGTFAQKLDDLLSSNGALVTAFEVLVVHQQKGTEAARQVIDDYSNREDLTIFQKQAIQKLRDAQAVISSTDYRPYISMAIIFACASNLGPHEGAAIGALIVHNIFPDISKVESLPRLPEPGI